MTAPVPLDAEKNHDEVLLRLRNHGSHATAFQILEPGYIYWLDDASETVIAYVRSGRRRVCAGPPVGPEAHLGGATRRFTQETHAAGERVVFFCVDDAFIAALKESDQAPRFDTLPIGEQPTWDPRDYTLEGRERRTLRSQVRRAERKGVRVRRPDLAELSDPDSPTRRGIERCLDQWEKSRRMSVMGFMVDVRLFHLIEERRYYVAELDGEVVAFLAAVPIYAGEGWFFEDMIRQHHAPNGTIELLVHEAMQDAQAEGLRFVTLGLAPLANIPDGDGPHPALRAVMRWSYKNLGAFYGFESLHRFKQRFSPHGWQRQYLLTSGTRLGLFSIEAILRAFAGGGLVSFGLDTARRLFGDVPRRIWMLGLSALTLGLVAWTGLFVQPGVASMVGADTGQALWLGFDLLMIIGLLGLIALLSRRHRAAPALALLLTSLTLLDALSALTQGFFLRLPSHLLGWTLSIVSVSGPMITTLVLAALSLGFSSAIKADPPDATPSRSGLSK